jgi:hypothetical protein
MAGRKWELRLSKEAFAKSGKRSYARFQNRVELNFWVSPHRFV